MNIEKRIEAFVKLGRELSSLAADEDKDWMWRAKSQNPWFTEDNITFSLNGIAKLLTEEKLNNWVSNYQIIDQGKKIGIVMAGNIPMVGFHDLLCILISGNIAVIKMSSQDEFLMTTAINKLIDIEPLFKNQIIIQDQLKDIDAIIATGSDNTSRYFEFYFAKYPNIIRKNRTSVAILTGQESREELEQLGKDIFQYFGLGCRNVSKLLVPDNYDFTTFFESIESYNHVAHHHKYTNNYDYNKSIYLVNGEDHLDNGFLLLKKDEALVSPISVLFYENYQSESDLSDYLKTHSQKIQCIVTNGHIDISDAQQFGQAQLPELEDYADGVDTLQFLTSL
ncbi:acyl-CoA reductase [Fulvivirga ligni]|uniref:acyl-CoA reductase n=1 Tax=Fulvivirga ligni TaxID=2904246 RepID=UPI001F34A05E|nr:acyl-CoA reductase [Fulvivirga ligni]UII20414.1 acyl-CoA reductase [Fulvivirga ligni]